MRIKITAISKSSIFFPYNYNYALHSALYSLIQKSSPDYSGFLHDKGYVKDGINRIFKFFTFSKLNFFPKKQRAGGFCDVKKIKFVFSTIMEESLKHLILGIFSNEQMVLELNGKQHKFDIVNVDIQKNVDFNFNDTARFICLSPIAISTVRINEKDKREQHFLDYMDQAEREHFVRNVRKNLIKKYETINNIPYKSIDLPFNFFFNEEYIAQKKGKISKLIGFKNNIKIKAMEAPFHIKADPELIKIGYECGWGEKNSAGFGCVKLLL